MKKTKRLPLRHLYRYSFSVPLEQKQCVRDYKHAITPVFITAHITVCLCPTYCNGVVWFDGCLGRGFLSFTPIILLSASLYC